MWTIFKVFIEFVTILLPLYVLVFWPRGMWYPTSPARDRTCTPLHWKAKSQQLDCQGIPNIAFFIIYIVSFSYESSSPLWKPTCFN